MFPAPVILADVGGTNCRIACIPAEGAPYGPMHRLPTAGFARFAEALGAAVAEGLVPRPRSVLVAGAGPIEAGPGGPTLHLTNPGGGSSDGFVIDAADLVAHFGLAQGLLLNDFEALAIALPHLAHVDVRTIGPALRSPPGPMVVVGAGTGLGVAALLPIGPAFLPVASEGGHVELGALHADEAAFWPHLPRFDGRIGAEHLLSGAGLARLDRARAQAAGLAPADRDATAITSAALAGEPTARDTVTAFFRLLGRVAGDHALTFHATGGLWIGGGIAPRHADLLDGGAFREAFEAKAPHQPLMATIPTRLITAPDAALKGLAALVRAPDSILIDWEQRLWRCDRAG
jgi:glucokinase